MDTRPDAERLAGLKQELDDLKNQAATQHVPRAVIAANIRELDREITALEGKIRGR